MPTLCQSFARAHVSMTHILSWIWLVLDWDYAYASQDLQCECPPTPCWCIRNMCSQDMRYMILVQYMRLIIATTTFRVLWMIWVLKFSFIIHLFRIHILWGHYENNSCEPRLNLRTHNTRTLTVASHVHVFGICKVSRCPMRELTPIRTFCAAIQNILGTRLRSTVCPFVQMSVVHGCTFSFSSMLASYSPSLY